MVILQKISFCQWVMKKKSNIKKNFKKKNDKNNL